MTLGPDEVHVHYRLVDPLDQHDDDRAMRILSSVERDRAGRFVFARDRRSFMEAHALLRRTLSSYAPVEAGAWRFVAGSSGKPALAPEFSRIDLRFNLAHTDDLVACVVSRLDRVGIDVEATDREIQPLDLAARHFSPDELADLHACAEGDRRLRFLEIWTLKEAYVKAVGTGLSESLHTFGFRFDGQSSIRFEGPARAQSRQWAFALFAPSGRHRMAVAACGRSAAALHITAFPGVDALSVAALRTSGVAGPDEEKKSVAP